ncbi:MAG: arginine--tRNA ligase [Candidatus Altiarchaeota archaeon]|nr:arginine--tRNA ligase [Candidatus Altiarchaeota archaeon]
MKIEQLMASAKTELAKQTGLSETKIHFGTDKFGDFASSLPIRLAKSHGKDPETVAKELARKIKLNGLEAKTENGFLNFYLTQEAIKHNLAELFKFPQSGKTVVFDYSSPNLAKPFTVGHLRSTVIADSLRHLFELFGWKTIHINFFGDWGLQFGKLMAAYKLWGGELEPEPIKKLLKLYVKFHKQEENDKSVAEAGRVWFKKLEDGDGEALALLERFKKLSLAEFNRIYEMLGASTDYVYGGESLFVKHSIDLVDALVQKRIAKKDQGAIVVPVEGLPPMILRKQDGTTIYGARDLASAVWRINEFKPDLMLYVVGSEQSFHFKQWFSVFKKMGHKTPVEHVKFGLIRLPEGKLSTRKGKVIFLEDIIEEAITRVNIIMKDKEIAEPDETARIIAVGAIKFADLKTNRTRDVLFSWDMLKTNGETGPYVQYAAVRAKRILEKSDKKPKWGELDSAETELARNLVKFRLAVLDAVAERRPDLLANYLLKLTQGFNEFYETCPVIGSGRAQRLYLVELTQKVLETGLGLLGISVPTEM